MLSTPIGLATVLSGGFLARLAADLGLDAAYRAVDDGVLPTICAMTFTVKRDGSWTMTVGADDSFTLGTTFSGFWTLDPSADVGDGFEVQYTSANQVNSPTITNNAVGYTAITGDITYLVSKGSGATSSVDMTANFRRAGGSAAEMSDTTNMQVTGG